MTWKGNPSDKPLTKAQEKFVTLVAVEKMTQAQAYRQAYPAAQKWTQAAVDVRSYQCMKLPQCTKKYNQIVEALREESIKNAIWSREKAIEAATFVYESGRREVERIERAFDEEIDNAVQSLQDAIKRDDRPDEIRKISDLITKLKKSKRMAMTPTVAMTGAMDTLNKLQGFNKENISVVADVNFGGEDKLED